MEERGTVTSMAFSSADGAGSGGLLIDDSSWLGRDQVNMRWQSGGKEKSIRRKLCAFTAMHRDWLRLNASDEEIMYSESNVDLP